VSALLAFLARRLAISLVLLLVLVMVTFAIFVAIPANPGRIFYPPGTPVTNEELAEANRVLGTDRPLHVQFGKYVWRLLHADFGISWLSGSVDPQTGELVGTPARDLLVPAAGVTGSLVLGGALLLALLSVPLGLVAASRANTLLDRTLIALAIVAISTHPIVAGLVLRIAFSDQLDLVPPAGYCPVRPAVVEVPRAAGGMTTTQVCGGPVDWAHHLILPWIAFALFFVAIYMRMIRARTIEVLEQPFVRTARAKGAPEWRVLTRHGLRNVLAPVITMLAMDAGTALGISIYIETVFGLPGVGNLAVQALAGQTGYDLPMILGIVMTTGVAIIVLNLLADLVCFALDPRIRASGGRPAAAASLRSA